MTREFDPIQHPKHYNDHPSGIETIRIAEHFSGCMFNCLKYVFRAGKKESETREKDLRKALWYAERERLNLSRFRKHGYRSVQEFSLVLVQDLAAQVSAFESDKNSLLNEVMRRIREWDNNEFDESKITNISLAIKRELEK